MSPTRLTFQNWIVALGRDPSAPPANGLVSAADGRADDSGSDTEKAVEEALELLSEQEKYLIIRLYYMGQGYVELSRLSGRSVHRLAAMHRRALRKLKTGLARFVRRRYGIQPKTQRECAICQSPFREEIDALISGRDQKQTWRPVMAELIRCYALRVKSPQVLISHEKYHKYCHSHQGGKR